MNPGERRQAYITGGLGLVDRELQGGRTGVVVTGLALRSSETGQLVRLGLQKAETSRCLRGATDVEDGVVEPVLDAGQLAEHRVAANVQPRVVDRSQPVLDVVASVDAALLVTGRDRGSGGEEPVRGLIPRPVQPVVESSTAIGQLHRLAELAVMRHDVGEVVTAARLQVDIIDRVGQFGGCGDVVAGEFEVTRRRFDPRREQQGAGPVPDRGGVAGRVECGQDPLCASAVAEDDPGPTEPVDDAEREQRVVRWRSRPARRRCWRARPGRRRDARPGDCCAHLGWRIRLRQRTMRRARRGRARTARRRSSLRARTPGCCRAAGSGRAIERTPRRRRSPANGSRAGRPRRSPRLPARRALRGRTRPPAAARRRRRWQGPTGPAGRRGTAARSSIGSSTLSARRRSGLRLVGSLNTLKRSSRRRVISSIDNVLVRAAASSIASGRPSSERHRSRTASVSLAERSGQCVAQWRDG